MKNLPLACVLLLAAGCGDSTDVTEETGTVETSTPVESGSTDATDTQPGTDTPPGPTDTDPQTDTESPIESGSTDPTEPTDTDTTDSPNPTDSGAPASNALCEVIPPTNPCVRPGPPDLPRFEDPTVDVAWTGIDYNPNLESLFPGGGISLADVTGDGRIDAIISQYDGILLFVQQPSGSFADETDAYFAGAQSITRPTTATPADYDGDGDLDLMVTAYAAANKLFRNDGSTFTDVTTAAGIIIPNAHRSTGSSFADMNGDGYLDMVVTGYGQFYTTAPRPPGDISYLFLNQGNGTFSDISSQLTSDFNAGYSFMAGWHDIDDDGAPELYSINDFGNAYPNTLLTSSGGSMSAYPTITGLEFGIQGMGLTWGDLNNDTCTDMMVSGLRNNRVMINSCSNTWTDFHLAYNIDADLSRGQHFAWGVHFVDLDNDTQQEVIQGFGQVFNQPSPGAQPDALYVATSNQTGVFYFTDEGEDWGFSHEGQTRGVAIGDVNDDGWIDVARQDLTGPATLQYNRCHTSNHWLKVKPRMEIGANTRAVGAKIVVTTTAAHYTGWIHAGGNGIFSANPYEAHFGLDDKLVVNDVTINWPNGETSSCTNVPADHTLKVTYIGTPTTP